jgi:hypothetical protein
VAVAVVIRFHPLYAMLVLVHLTMVPAVAGAVVVVHQLVVLVVMVHLVPCSSASYRNRRLLRDKFLINQFV